MRRLFLNIAQARCAWASSIRPLRLSCSCPTVPQNASSLAADASKKEESGSSDATYSVDPNDPLKFFTQQDNTFTDGVQLALVLAVLYTVVQVLKLANGVK